MFLLYSFLLAIGFLAFLPRFLFQKKYAASFSERLGNLPEFDAKRPDSFEAFAVPASPLITGIKPLGN